MSASDLSDINTISSFRSFLQCSPPYIPVDEGSPTTHIRTTRTSIKQDADIDDNRDITFYPLCSALSGSPFLTAWKSFARSYVVRPLPRLGEVVGEELKEFHFVFVCKDIAGSHLEMSGVP